MSTQRFWVIGGEFRSLNFHQLVDGTQQVIGHESGVADFIDPLGGSWAVESLTDEIEKRANAYLAEIEKLGGMVAAIEKNYPQKEIERRAYEHQRAVEAKQRIVVGVNEYVMAEEDPVPVAKVDPALEEDQVRRVQGLRSRRNAWLSRRNSKTSRPPASLASRSRCSSRRTRTGCPSPRTASRKNRSSSPARINPA